MWWLSIIKLLEGYLVGAKGWLIYVQHFYWLEFVVIVSMPVPVTVTMVMLMYRLKNLMFMNYWLVDMYRLEMFMLYRFMDMNWLENLVLVNNGLVYMYRFMLVMVFMYMWL
jgi:hypothetical protein